LHTEQWLGVAVSNEMNKGAAALEFVEHRTEPDGEHRVVYYRTPDGWNGLEHRRRDRRNEDDQLVERRFYQGSLEPPTRTLILTYDEQGRVIRVHRHTEMPPTETKARLRYDCGEAGR
jgi:hypothetical protein